MSRLIAPILLLVSSLASADWYQLRHDAAHSGYTEDLVEPPLELRWTLPTKGLTDPLLAAGDSLYNNSATTGFIRVTFDTGEPVWQHPARQQVIAVEDGFVVEAFAIPPRNPDRVGFVILSADTGEPLHSITTDDALYDPAINRPDWFSVNDGVIAVSDRQPGPDGRRRALEPWLRYFAVASGNHIGETRCVNNMVVGPKGSYVPISPYKQPFQIHAWGEELMLLMHYDRQAPDPIYVDGEGWVRPRSRPMAGPWALATYRIVGMTPAEAEGRLFEDVALSDGASVAVGIIVERGRSYLAGRDAGTGELLWSHNDITASAIAVDGVAAHFTGVDGVNYALDLETGEVLWQTTVGKSLELQEKEDEALKTLGKPTPPRARTSPIITDEAVWLAWDGKLIALHVPTGEVLWSADIEHREIGGLTAHAEWLYY
ncbi:MAG TPA: PQQ-binding-like beta-propeller repeat protein, partial [Armatimonadota bacterium]|nr:PQQ-binding-like beta-propeller repeat protein [Armatimonadota bacterium]